MRPFIFVIALALACGTSAPSTGSGSSGSPTSDAGTTTGASDAGGAAGPDAGTTSGHDAGTSGGAADAGSGTGGSGSDAGTAGGSEGSDGGVVAGGGGADGGTGSGGGPDAGQPTPTRYTVQEIAIPGMQVTVKGLNDAANVVGEYTPGADDGEHGHGFLWDGPSATWRDIGPADRYSIGVGLNNHFDIALGVFSPNPPGTTNREHAWLLKDGQRRDLGALPSGDPTAAPWAINSSAVVVGVSLSSSSNAGHAFLADASGIHDLGSIDGGSSAAHAVNDSGVAAGEATVHGDIHAARFDSTGVHDLGTIGGTYSTAYGINSRGVIVGLATPPGVTGFSPHLGFVVDPTDGVMRPVPPPPGFTSSLLTAINDSGLAVGSSQEERTNHALLYDTTTGQSIDLNDRIDAPGWVLLYAVAINARGQILGTGTRDGIYTSFLATPKQ
jgi:hypothetical protein